MARIIKVTGYISVNDLEPEEIDLESPTGLSEEGFENMMNGLSETSVNDVSFELGED